MDSIIRDKAEYIIVVVSMFARQYGLTDVQAYRYLNRYKAIDFLDNQYKVAHTLTFEDVISGLTTFCQRHGGAIA